MLKALLQSTPCALPTVTSYIHISVAEKKHVVTYILSKLQMPLNILFSFINRALDRTFFFFI
ncbi:hypothetical protein PHJA_002304700 [Phtheirospermum japonicum]|uniref:Uncharacterized protein n=1 Tax=Phtheirospermum japonicum TaxID=374723 RepID=A0A830CLR1_9LAMI|nr:hypothetical protein PHJA_002304700 [Phtheirospermum japonicum]